MLYRTYLNLNKDRYFKIATQLLYQSTMLEQIV